MNDETLAAAYDASSFRALARRWSDMLADYLIRAYERPGSMPVLPHPRATDDLLAQWRQRLATAPAEPTALLQAVIDASIHLHQPGYVGHQVSAPLPLASLCEWASALLNNGMAVFEMGPAATAIEQATVRWMTRHVGWPETADGAFVSGGSLANLLGLLAARHERAGFSVWHDGAHAGPPLAALASSQAHYCSARAVQVMGWGAGGLVPVDVDDRFRLRPDRLEAAKAAAEKAGRKVVAVVASACSTATGAYDPLEPIADFCAAHHLWLHVDGAHGASALLSAKYRGLLRGIERADSVTWDAHKMLMMPALATGILFRDGAVGRRLFSQQASYLFHDDDAYDLGHRTLECTKRMMALPLYACLAVYGEAFFSHYVTSRFDLARAFAARLRSLPDFDLALDPECNIVCFRYVPAHLRHAPIEQINRWQTAIREHVIAAGSHYLVQTRLGEALYLRTTLIHPLTNENDLEALLDALRAAGDAVVR